MFYRDQVLYVEALLHKNSDVPMTKLKYTVWKFKHDAASHMVWNAKWAFKHLSKKSF